MGEVDGDSDVDEGGGVPPSSPHQLLHHLKQGPVLHIFLNLLSITSPILKGSLVNSCPELSSLSQSQTPHQHLY